MLVPTLHVLQGASDLDDSMADLQRQQLEPLLADLGEIAVDFEQTVDGGQSELWSSKQQNLQSVSAATTCLVESYILLLLPCMFGRIIFKYS